MLSIKARLFSAGLLTALTGFLLFFMDSLMTDDNPYGYNPDTVNTLPEDSIAFSHTEYFYKEDISLSLSSSETNVGEIFYTLDSTSPAVSDSRKLFENEISLTGTSNEQPKSYVIKVCGRRTDGTYTNVYTHSYFVGEKIDMRFNVPVFSLSTDPDNLYDYETGIFVKGKLRDDYIAETGDRNPDPPAPANYNMRGIEAERPVYVEMLSPQGEQLLSQNAGMRTFGGWSRDMAQKSIKLYARSEYDAVRNDFDYEIFEGNTDYNGMAITNYKRIVLRNNANDNPFGFLRDETISSMAAQTGLQDTQNTCPAAVFLNGEYYGFVWVHEVYDDTYFDDMNGIKDGEWAVLSGGEHYKEEPEDDPLSQKAAGDYETLYSYSEMDLTDDAVFNELSGLMDIDNFLKYYAVEIYVANGDWPAGNYEAYRYYGSSVRSDYPVNTTDGKWRWLLYDTDFGLGLYDTSPSEDTLGILLGQRGNDESKRSDLLIALLSRDDIKEKFIGIMCDMMNLQFSPENVRDTAQRLEALRYREVENNFRFGGAQLSDTWSDMRRVNEEVTKAIRFGNSRPEEMKKQLVKYLGISEDGFNISIEKNDTAAIKANTCLIDENSGDFSGFYFDLNKVTVSAEVSLGYEFSHWVVNDEIYTSEDLEITKLNAGADDGTVTVRLVTVKSGEIKPVIKLLDYERDMDFIQITNPFGEEINLRNYYISDDSENLFKQTLADCILEPGQTVSIYCRNYSAFEALGGFYLGFNLKNNETLYITDNQGQSAETVLMPKINNDYVLVRDMKTGRFYDCKREDSGALIME